MTSIKNIELKPDEFALYFAGNQGVDLDALANFLKRVSSVARRHGGELVIVGLHEGSLVVKLRAIARSKIAQNAIKEFSDKPIDGSVKVTGLIAAIAGAIIWLMSPTKDVTPIAKAGAEIIDKHQITEISVVTNEKITVVMNEAIAKKIKKKHEIRAVGRASEKSQITKIVKNQYNLPEIEIMVKDAHQSNLTGEVALVGDAFHFQPDGYHYWVPIYMRPSSSVQLHPGERYRIGGQIKTLNGQPDQIIAASADLITGRSIK